MANSILHIRQIKQNFGIQFQCFERDSLLYIGEDAFLNEHLPARLLTPSNEEILRYNADVRGIAQAYIPLNNKSDHTGFLSNSQGNNMGRFYQSGIGRNKYYCTEFQNRTFNIYLFSSVTEKLLIYDEERQIGQVEKSKFTKNNLDTYTMYLLDGYSYFHALFCFSVMLYDKFEHGHQGEFFSGTKNTASMEWTVAGIGKKMYHKEFMAENFPDAVIESKDLTVETFKEELSDSARYVAKATFTKRNFLDGFYSRFAILFIGGLLFLVALLCCFLDEPLIASIPVVILVIYLLVGLILKKSIKGKQDSEID